VINAVVLIEADRDVLSQLGGMLADVPGVAEAYSVTGEWDFACIVRVPRHEQLADVISGTIAKLSGVTRTQTLVAFEAFSKHDLEALFDVGNTPPEPGA
jgi:DNA-binding Lrp family transcriptional regulator